MNINNEKNNLNNNNENNIKNNKNNNLINNEKFNNGKNGILPVKDFKENISDKEKKIILPSVKDVKEKKNILPVKENNSFKEKKNILPVKENNSIKVKKNILPVKENNSFMEKKNIFPVEENNSINTKNISNEEYLEKFKNYLGEKILNKLKNLLVLEKNLIENEFSLESFKQFFNEKFDKTILLTNSNIYNNYNFIINNGNLTIQKIDKENLSIKYILKKILLNFQDCKKKRCKNTILDYLKFKFSKIKSKYLDGKIYLYLTKMDD